MASAAFMPPPLERNYSTMDTPGTVTMMEALVNQKAGSYSSLYQSCVTLRRRLSEVPGFTPFLDDMALEEQDDENETDIVTIMWNMLRQGYPLMTLFNALRPRVPLEIDQASYGESKIAKAATFKFLQGCMQELRFPVGECFLISDLYGKDTAGFLKVLKVVDRVLDILEDRKLLLKRHAFQNPSNSNVQPQKLNYQENVIQEIVTTERNYVQHLDTLQQFKNELTRSNVITGDIVHEIFMNLDSLVDYQRRFLIRVEQQNILDPSTQNWGRLFLQYAKGFQIYEPFIANQDRSNQNIMKGWSKIKTARVSESLQGMLSDSNALTGFLLKPLQRITKYPLLLDQLIQKGNYDEERRDLLIEGRAAIGEVVDVCNQAAEMASRAQEVARLREAVDDWKGHRLDHFGDLVISGQHTVLKGDTAKAEEREYKIYLFERILLCCKEMNLNKPKNRLASRNTNKTGKSPRLQLKGRIFIQNVTDIMKNEDQARSNNKPYLLKVLWKGDPAIESFNVCFQNHDVRDKWYNLATTQRSKLPRIRDPTSATEFVSLVGKELQNPYREPLEDNDDDEEPLRLSEGSTLVSSQEYSSSRNASNTSLRSRSTTGGSEVRIIPPSSAGLGPTRPPRFPLPDPGYSAMNPPSLKVSTSFTPGTPDDRAVNSYFSPIGDSPSSSIRSSSQSGTITPLPFRGQTPTNGSRPYDTSKHNTAPPGTYQDRQAQRPPLASAPHSSNYMQTSQSRSRSLSSSDIHQNQHSPGKRYVNGQGYAGAEDVPVPPIPSHMMTMRGPVNRSQTNSPGEVSRYGRSQTPVNQYGHPPTYNNLDGQPRSNSRQGHQYMGPGPTPHGNTQRVVSPLPANGSQFEAPIQVSQVMVKILYKDTGGQNRATIVVPFNIRYQSLVDRVDSKMEKILNRSANRSIFKGTARIRYRDNDGDMCSIKEDEDIQIAFDEWKKKNVISLAQNKSPGDFELQWQSMEEFRS